MIYSGLKIEELGNSHIVQSLLDQFHLPKDFEPEQGYSSHWKDRSSRSLIKVESGVFTQIQGEGFGNFSTPPGWSNKLMGLLNYLSYAPALIWVFPKFFLALYHLRKAGIGLLTYDSLRQAALAANLAKWIGKIGISPKQICMIGDGYGVLGFLLKQIYPKSKITFIDIGNTLTFCSIFIGKNFNNNSFSLLGPSSTKMREKNNSPEVDSSDFCFIPAENIRSIELNARFDLFINVASMQEMTPFWISWYFEFIRKHKSSKSAFYCCNREYKTLPGGEELIFEKYPWDARDKIIFDEEPRFYRWFFSRELGRKNYLVFGIPIPFMKSFDGRLKHRLLLLNSP
mgnify:CR=1 FL=1